MLELKIDNDGLRIGPRFMVNFERTLRIPDDGKTYPLPPSLGRFPIKRIADYADRVPEDWAAHGGVFIPMYQREALWLRFIAAQWKPQAVKVAVGKINAVSGKAWQQALSADEHDYLVCPPQPWLDGINAGDGMIRQFVAMPLGMGYTVEGQLTGEERFGGIQLIVYEPRPGRFPDEPPPISVSGLVRGAVASAPFAAQRASMGAVPGRARGAEMGLGAGGRMKQKIYPDPHGVGTWDSDHYGRVYVHIVNSMAYRDITGEEPPTTPISAQTYARFGYPWFDLYDEHKPDIAAPDALQGVKSIKEMDQAHGFEPQQDDSSVEISDDAVIHYPVAPDPDDVVDGDW